VQPGAIETGMTAPTFAANPEFAEYWRGKAALKRLGQPDDVAAVIAFLSGDDAGFVSGHGIFVDGGAMQHS
jgi:NAD(P)-dependent dehydrogenase (short-subunit alcohol dehydrogenase family)